MNNGDLLSEFDWEMMARNPDTDQAAWTYGTSVIDDFFAPDAPFWTETNNDGRLIESNTHFPFSGQAGSGQAGSGMTTGGGPGSGMQMHTGNSNDFMPTHSSSEVLDAVVSTNQQSSPPAFLDSAFTSFMSPSITVNSAEMPTGEKAQISNMSSLLPFSVFSGEHDDGDIKMKDSSTLPYVRGTTPVIVGREGAQTLPYGTDGTTGRTPSSAQQPLQQRPGSSSRAPGQTLRTTPAMTAYSSPYYRGRHTQSTNGAESLRRDMEQQTSILPTATAAIPFPGLQSQGTVSPAQEVAIKANRPVDPLAKPTSTRKAKAPIENQMFAVLLATDNGTPIEKLAKGSELGFKSPFPKAAKAAKAARAPKRKAAQPEPMQQAQDPAPPASKKSKTKTPRSSVSSREVRLLTGAEVKGEDSNNNKRKTRASVKAGGEATVDGPDAGKAVRQRRGAKK